MTNVKTYVGSDGLLHFTDWSGADSVLNFSKGASQGTMSLTLSGSASAKKSNVTGTASISGTTNFLIDFANKTVSVSSGAYTIAVNCQHETDGGRSGSAGVSRTAKVV